MSDAHFDAGKGSGAGKPSSRSHVHGRCEPLTRTWRLGAGATDQVPYPAHLAGVAGVAVDGLAVVDASSKGADGYPVSKCM